MGWNTKKRDQEWRFLVSLRSAVFLGEGEQGVNIQI